MRDKMFFHQFRPVGSTSKYRPNVQKVPSGIPSGHSTHLFEIVSSVLNTLLDSKRNLKPGWTSILIIVKLKRAPKLFLNRLMQECSKIRSKNISYSLHKRKIITNADSVLAFPESNNLDPLS